MIKIGVVGVGSMGKNHVRIYNELKDVELVGVSDTNVETGVKVAADYKTSYMPYQNLTDKEFLDNCSPVDAIDICVPTKYHYEVAKHFLNEGIDTFIEKPIASTMDQARELISLAAKNDCVLQVGHIEQFNPAMTYLKQMGMEIRHIEAHRVGTAGQRITDAGVVLDLMIHDIDLICSLIGEKVYDIKAVGNDDFTTAMLVFASATATLTASRITQKRQRTLAITDKDRYILADFMNRSIDIYKQTKSNYTGSNYTYTDVLERPQIPQVEPLKAELQSFIDCCNGGKPVVDGWQALKALEIALKIQEITQKKDY